MSNKQNKNVNNNNSGVIKGVTKTGFRYTIQKKQLENYELFEAITELENDLTVFPNLLKLLLGPNQIKALKNHVREKDGTVPIEKMTSILAEIMKNQQPIKNS